MLDNNWESLTDLELALKLADIADEISMARYQAIDLVVETKPDLTPVSDADRAVEDAIRNQLLLSRKSDAIIGEEFGSKSQASSREWIIDPIDGTKNFIRSVPVWATLIALRQDGEIVVGVVSSPALAKRWYASKGDGAFLIDNIKKSNQVKKINCSKVKKLEDASISISSFDKKGGWVNLQEKLLKLVDLIWRNRGYGDFWSHMLVAEGAIDFAIEPKLALWDMAALEIIVKEAGGRFSDLSGNDGVNGSGAISSNGLLHNLVLEQINNA